MNRCLYLSEIKNWICNSGSVNPFFIFSSMWGRFLTGKQHPCLKMFQNLLDKNAQNDSYKESRPALDGKLPMAIWKCNTSHSVLPIRVKTTIHVKPIRNSLIQVKNHSNTPKPMCLSPVVTVLDICVCSMMVRYQSARNGLKKCIFKNAFWPTKPMKSWCFEVSRI